jgi:hypothetical protein
MKEKIKEQEPLEQKINIDDFLSSVSNVVFSNLKLYIDRKFQELEDFFKTIEDSKLNISTLSSLLYSKKLFTKEEFRSCFREVEESFGIVLPDGTIKGHVEVTFYNFPKPAAQITPLPIP